MELNLDFRLLEVSLEFQALEEHFNLLEKQILIVSDEEKKLLEENRRKEKFTPEDPEWDFFTQVYERKVEFLLPRFFWGPFIVSLYAVLEASIIEISRLIKNNQKQGIDINDLKGDFLERAKKYYKNVIKFQLCKNDSTWQSIKILSLIRNAIAHANGRLDMLNEGIRKSINLYTKQKLGISTYYEYLLVDSSYVKNSLLEVKSMLESLVDRYKAWDSMQKSV